MTAIFILSVSPDMLTYIVISPFMAIKLCILASAKAKKLSHFLKAFPECEGGGHVNMKIAKCSCFLCTCIVYSCNSVFT